MPRVALISAAAVLVAAGARDIADPPRPSVVSARTVAPATDLAAEDFAQEFARAYLTWDGERPDDHERRLARFASSSLEPGAGLRLPSGGHQAVSSTTVVDDQLAARGRVVTVAAQTTAGEIRLAITVARDPRGLLFVADYPAVVGPPPSNPAAELRDEEPVVDDRLARVARRAIANFLAGERGNLLADLDAGALVVLPEQRLELRDVQDITWVRTGRRVAVVLEAALADTKTVMTLRYELGVIRRAGRWFVRSVETNPPSREASR